MFCLRKKWPLEIIIPDNEAETHEDKYFHSSHISSLNEPSGNCIKDSEFESGEKVCIVKDSFKKPFTILA